MSLNIPSATSSNRGLPVAQRVNATLDASPSSSGADSVAPTEAPKDSVSILFSENFDGPTHAFHDEYATKFGSPDFRTIEGDEGRGKFLASTAKFRNTENRKNMISPPISLGYSDNAVLSFEAKTSLMQGEDALVRVRDVPKDGSVPPNNWKNWKTLKTLHKTKLDSKVDDRRSQTPWTEYTVDLSGLRGKTVEFNFHVTDNRVLDNRESALQIDNVKVLA